MKIVMSVGLDASRKKMIWTFRPEDVNAGLELQALLPDDLPSDGVVALSSDVAVDVARRLRARGIELTDLASDGATALAKSA